MRVLAFGGRKFADPCRTPDGTITNPNWKREREIVFSTLDDFHAKHTITVLIEGEARGADRTAKEWARAHNVLVEPYVADWKNHRNAAGPIRNRVMLMRGKPERAISFPGETGTAHMLGLLRQAAIPVLLIPR